MEPQEQGSNRWVLDRKTTDGKHLIIGIDTATREIALNEWGEGGTTFQIMCREVSGVEIHYGDIKIFGDIEYRISSKGASHEVFLPNASHSGCTVSKFYHFDN